MGVSGVLEAGLVAARDEAADRRQRPARLGRMVQAIVLAVPVVWILAVGWAHRFMTEDGFIYLRVVQQIRAGNGPVFNQGERVEAFTGVLWVAVLSIADLVTPVRLEWLAVVMGIAATAVGVALSLAGARRLCARYAGDAAFVPLGALVFVAVFPAWAYASSGLETGLVFAWLGGCFWILADWAANPGRGVSAPRAVILGLGWLVRPEMVLYSAVFVLVVVAAQWKRDGWKRQARFVAVAVAVPVAYQMFRMGFYGSLVANTAIAKEGGSSNWERGWRYFSDFAGPYWLWVPAVGLLAGGYLPLGAVLARARDRRRAVVVFALPVCGLINAVYVIGVGGDYHHARMFLPALFAVCAPVAAVPVARRHLAGIAVGAWALVAAVALRPDQHDGDNWLANGFLAPRDFGIVTTDDFGWGDSGPYINWYTGPAYYYEAGIYLYRRSDMAIRTDLDLPFGAFHGVGVPGYAVGTDFHVLDQMGLADSFTAHLRLEPSPVPRFPGHEKPLPAPWVAARVTPEGSTPDPTNFPALDTSKPVPSVTEFQEQVAWARAALACDDVTELLEAAEEPLSPGRFTTNLLRSFEHTRLRIPADPEEAYHRFCGPGTPPEVRAARAATSD